MTGKTKVQEKEIDKLQKQLDTYDENIKSLTLDRMNEAPKEESAPVELSQKQIEKAGEVYIKPTRWMLMGRNLTKITKNNGNLQKNM